MDVTGLPAAPGGHDPLEPCSTCLMSRLRFARSRATITLENGLTIETCMVSLGRFIRGRKPKRVRVADAVSRKPIDALTAYWVIERSRQCPMSSVELWAFAREQDARAYIGKHSGVVCSWEEAMKAVGTEQIDRVVRKASSRFSDNHRGLIPAGKGATP